MKSLIISLICVALLSLTGCAGKGSIVKDDLTVTGSGGAVVTYNTVTGDATVDTSAQTSMGLELIQKGLGLIGK